MKTSELYLCAFLGDGLGRLTAYRPKIADIVDGNGAKAFAWRILNNKTTAGHPAINWCLCVASGEDHTLADGVSGILRIPRNAVDNPIPAQIKTALLNRGIDLSADATVRSALRRLVKMHQPDRDEKDVL